MDSYISLLTFFDLGNFSEVFLSTINYGFSLKFYSNKIDIFQSKSESVIYRLRKKYNSFLNKCFDLL